MAGTYGLHDNRDKCQSFSHENRRSDYPAAKHRTPDDKMSLCNACKKKWERDNWPHELTPSNAGGNATERSEGRVDHNVGRQTPEED